MTIIVQDDHLTAGAWATCGQIISDMYLALIRSPH